MTPIERQMYEALVRTAPATYELQDLIDDCAYGDGEYVVLEAQVPLLTYFADLCLTTAGGSRLAIECDGHDYHNLTKQQAAYDRARDRELLAVGIPTIRFTGSEIHHSAERCAREAWAIFARVLRHENAVLHAHEAGFETGRHPEPIRKRDI